MAVLTAEIVLEFFRERGATDKCMSCGSAEWVWIADGTNDLFLAVPFAFRNPSGNPGDLVDPEDKARPLVAMACLNCGFLRLHDSYPIETWHLRREVKA